MFISRHRSTEQITSELTLLGHEQHKDLGDKNTKIKVWPQPGPSSLRIRRDLKAMWLARLFYSKMSLPICSFSHNKKLGEGL